MTRLNRLKKKREYYQQARSDNPCRQLFKQVKQNAKRRGLKFELTFEKLVVLTQDMHCAITDVVLIWDGGPLAPSIDRIDNDKGYLCDNVRVVSWIYNRAKGTNSDEEVRAFLLGPLRNNYGATSSRP